MEPTAPGNSFRESGSHRIQNCKFVVRYHSYKVIAPSPVVLKTAITLANTKLYKAWVFSVMIAYTNGNIYQNYKK